MALADWLAIVRQKIRDTAGKLAVEELARAIDEAVSRYSGDFPRQRAAIITGNGTAVLFALPADAEAGPSAVAAVEYPVDEPEPAFLDEDDYAVRVQTDDTWKLQLLGLVLPNAATARVYYRAPHSVTVSVDTVPVSDRGAVCNLAAALSARELAAYYSQTSESTIAADAVNYRTKNQEYLALATALEQAYEDFMTGASVAASVSRDLDVSLLSTAGVPRFYHGRR